MFFLAKKNLFQEKTRFLISVGGVAFSVMLILVLLSVYHGFGGTVKNYIKNIKAELWVTQEGTSDMFHSLSILPKDLSTKLKNIDGIREVEPYIGRAMVIDIAGGDKPVYLVGYDSENSYGGPLKIKEGIKDIKDNEIVMDKTFVKKQNLEVGDKVTIGKQDFKIVGISEGADMLMYQYHFITKKNAEEIFNLENKANYLLVRLNKNANLEKVRSEIISNTDGLKIFTEKEFIKANEKIVLGSFLPVVLVLVIIGFGVGVTVIGLTIYTATTEKSREYGVLKAIGAGSKKLIMIVIEQSLISGIFGYLFGLLLTFLVIWVAESFVPEFVTEIKWFDIAWVFGVSWIMGIIAALLPITKINKIDPALVFKS